MSHGQFRFDGRKVDAHRVAFMLAHGLPDLRSFGLIAHTCDNPLCVNPAHLEESTPSANLRDAWQRGRRNHTNLARLCAWFEQHPIVVGAPLPPA